MLASLDVPTTLSASPLWSIQRDYFASRGVEAWRHWEVPHYVTNSPVLAHTYARMIAGMLTDCAGRGGADETLYIVELGSGSGRLAHHVLVELAALVQPFAGSPPRYCYVLTDYVDSNIRFWNDHPRLRPFIEQGVLDVALFDATAPNELLLMHSGRRIGQRTLSHPLVVVANYFFDSIPQDLFYCEQHTIRECYISLRPTAEAPTAEAPTDEKAPPLVRLQIAFDYRPLAQHRYAEQRFNEMLDGYRRDLQQSYVLFPYAGISCLEWLRGVSAEGILLLCADKGKKRIDDIDGAPPPALAVHGNSFSLPVNFHAIASYYSKLGMGILASSHTARQLRVIGVLGVAQRSAYTHTVQSFHQAVMEFGPDDFYKLKAHVERQLPTIELDEWLAFLRLSRYDARVVSDSMSRLLELIPQGGAEQLDELREALARVWATYYSLGEQDDLAFQLGLLQLQMKEYEAAVSLFICSLKVYGDSAPVYYNMSLCFYYLSDLDKTMDCLEICLRMQPDHDKAAQLRAAIMKLRGES